MYKKWNTALFSLGAGVLLLLGATACSGGNAAEAATSAEMADTAAVVALEEPESTNSTATDSTATESTATDASSAESSDEITHPDGWTDASHSNDVDPNYDVVFPQDEVNQVTITISPEDWEAMQANMTELYGEPGSRSERGGPGGGNFSDENPMWVEATVEFNGTTWTHVGVRYKGNSSLMSSWSSGSQKLPLKLDFDEFEDDYPEIDNQRFYGFKQLSLANGFSDATYMRDAISYDLLEDAGLVAAETAFYEITVDYGEGPVNLGIYTAIEVIDDTVIDSYFGDDDGNIYEGDGSAVSLAEGTFAGIEESFQKENNEDEADWSDIETLYDVLHAEERTTDPDTWRAELESIFDVDTFLQWLALSATIEHWDTYGGMTHNFYLYHNPETDQLTWISWDHNQVLGSGVGGGAAGDVGGQRGPQAGGNAPPEGQPEPPAATGANAGERNPAAGFGGRGGPGRSVTLDKADVTEQWPLIRYLLDDPTYYDSYVGYLQEISETVFIPAELEAQYQQWADLLAPYVEDEAAFTAAVDALSESTEERAEAVQTFLVEQ